MKTQGVETTELQDIMIGFLEQNREGMISLVEWFLNSVMEMERAEDDVWLTSVSLVSEIVGTSD